MTIAEALTSGIVQGLTEFLPVSSSGHLVLIHKCFGFSQPTMFFDICLHAATLMAVLVYFGKDIAALVRERNGNWLLCVIIASVPAVAAALLFEDSIETFFTSPVKVASMLIVTSALLFAGQLCLRSRKTSGGGPRPGNSLFVGIAQAFALLPGISRSGATISSGILGGMKTEEAFRFSFIMSVPVIAGATLYKALTVDLGGQLSGNAAAYVSGMTVAFAAGLISLHFLRNILRAGRLYVFAIYCLLLGAAGMIFWK